jgi:hypothetical protein
MITNKLILNISKYKNSCKCYLRNNDNNCYIKLAKECNINTNFCPFYPHGIRKGDTIPASDDMKFIESILKKKN